MANSKDQIRTELQALVNEGAEILGKEIDIQKKKKGNDNDELLIVSYQEWYTKALPAVRQLLPERYAEFQGYSD